MDEEYKNEYAELEKIRKEKEELINQIKKEKEEKALEQISKNNEKKRKNKRIIIIFVVIVAFMYIYPFLVYHCYPLMSFKNYGPFLPFKYYRNCFLMLIEFGPKGCVRFIFWWVFKIFNISLPPLL